MGLKTDGLRIYSSLHNDIAKINQKYGLERGDRISETGARHRSTEEYYAELREKLMSENEPSIAMVGRICLPKSHPNIKKARKTLLFSFFNSIFEST